MSSSKAWLAGAALLVAAPVSAQRFNAVDAAINDGIETGIYPGAVVVIGRADTLLYYNRYGHFTWSATSRAPDAASTEWDLASLSKIVATTASAAVLVQEHKLDLDAPVSRYLPRYAGGRKHEVTVRMLLNHTSGMPAYTRLWLVARSPQAARSALFAVPLARAPGASAVYSDLNAMLAGLVIEQVSGMSLDAFARIAVFSPLGMALTMYRPPAADHTHIAPTGRYHGRPVSGVVNDQNAVALGGVSGHAGVFATGLDLARFAQAWLRAANGRGDWLTRSTVAEFLTRSATSDTRVLGWDTPVPPDSRKPSLYGRCATTSTYGHTGWTGTELWFDTAQDLFVVLLTNRSFAPRDAKQSFLQLKEVRARVADAVRTALGGCR